MGKSLFAEENFDYNFLIKIPGYRVGNVKLY